MKVSYDILREKRGAAPFSSSISKSLDDSIKRASALQLSQQSPEGYWWYTLEANEAIGAEYIQLMHFLGSVDEGVQRGLINRLLSEQNSDGSWSLYYQDGGDLNNTIEAYFVLKLTGHDINSAYMTKAREYILGCGGLTKCRVFTRIHLALFGVLPWSVCPAMPVELILLPTWMPVNIYEFSSWARACIIPLLVIMNKKPVKKLKDNFNLEELFVDTEDKRAFQFKHNSSFLSWGNFFIQFDKWLRLFRHVQFKPLKNQAVKACEKWICEHIEHTEDIYPAMAYAAMALYSLGHPLTHPTIAKCLSGLKKFQQKYTTTLPALPEMEEKKYTAIHQQCCISPVWDTPWSVTALLDSGSRGDDPRLIKAGRWLMSKQIKKNIGDWRIKNPHGIPGGWSFEFENDYFPDIDDTIQVLHVLKRLSIPDREKRGPIERGLSWILSMQNDDGGWAAFDKNNNLEMVNKIPFSDHGACLDPSSPDITARVITLLSQLGFTRDEGTIKKALDYLIKTQSEFGGWYGRWGINYVYGTWTVLVALKAIGEDLNQPFVNRAVNWLESIQMFDGGWGESPESYVRRHYVPYRESVPSQTAWALMGLMAARGIDRPSVDRGIDYLIKKTSEFGDFEERHFTGTGFPGHFYIRYHGYRHFFPLMALGQYRTLLEEKTSVKSVV